MTHEVVGQLDESFFETNWVCTAYDLLTGAIVGEVVANGNSFVIPVPNANPVRVCVEQSRHDIWRASTVVSVNQRTYPTDPAATPYYYYCITAGVTSSTEPVWPVTASATVIDGSSVWIIAEEIIKPTCHSPVIPTVA